MCPSNDFSSLPSATFTTLRNLSAEADGELRPVGAESEGEDGVGVQVVQAPHELARGHVPELHLARPRRLAAARGHELAVGAEVDRQDAEDVRAERSGLGPGPSTVQHPGGLVGGPRRAGRRRARATAWTAGAGSPAFAAGWPKAITPRPVAMSQTLTTPSAPAVTTRSPFGRNATASTGPPCGPKVAAELARVQVIEPGQPIVRADEHGLPVRRKGQGEHRTRRREGTSGSPCRRRRRRPRTFASPAVMSSVPSVERRASPGSASSDRARSSGVASGSPAFGRQRPDRGPSRRCRAVTTVFPSGRKAADVEVAPVCP